ncbi:NTF2-like N-terminal transpeptidase domain-containing protein [Aliarcobacter butzleri]|uniref:NTF2-like N-terminal transpeptidase domain-containing protein n=1 Tax=Aliarcobacter butzleri TaxID=28197 RepID=UPI00263D07C1|nr:NTF2-like N-terminal transpeptidase domain-containing protein [Aliarcobacter butzleri]MDN5049775.1 hypothetical protein [Aliarcobacter butzleri]MDN5056908.1 hypothetical protein [Aliarcobacter butzleri]
MKKNIDIVGLTKKQRLEELEKAKKEGYTSIEYTDNGITKSFTTFEIDEANIKQSSGLFTKIFLGIILTIIILIIISLSDNKEKETQSKSQITYNLKELKDSAVYVLDTTIYQKNDPKYIYARFLNAWEDKDYEKMVQFTTNDWKYKQKDPVQELKNIYSFKTIKSMKILDSKQNGTEAYKLTAFVEYSYIEKMENKINNSILSAMLIKNIDGTYGIQPLSIFMNEIVLKQ